MVPEKYIFYMYIYIYMLRLVLTRLVYSKNSDVMGVTFFFLWLHSPTQAASMKLYVSFQLLDLGRSVGVLGRVISSSQGTNTSPGTHWIGVRGPHSRSRCCGEEKNLALRGI
jgi:hypothetical protein